MRAPGWRDLDTAWIQLQAVGLFTAGFHAFRLMSKERVSWAGQTTDELYHGQVTLFVGQGGVRNRTTPKSEKEVFKTDVLPTIKRVLPDCPESFHLTLHYREGTLQEAEVITQ